MFRLTGALNKFLSWKAKNAPLVNGILTDLPFISGFQFNNQCDLSNTPVQKVSAIIKDPGILEVSLPPFNPRQILGLHFFSNQAICKMILIVSNLDTVKSDISDTATFNIPTENEIFQPPVLSLRTSTGTNELVVLVMAIQYSRGSIDLGRTEMITDLKNCPARLFGHTVLKNC